MAGVHHLKNTSKLSPYAAAKNVPMPDLAVKGTGVALIVGGTSILLGVKPRLGTAAIVGFLAGVSPVMLPFWSEQGEQRTNDLMNFTKNVALAGGAMALMGVDEPWPVSVPVLQPKRSKRLMGFFGRVAA